MLGSTFYQGCKCEDPGHSDINLKWLNPHNQEIKDVGPGTDSNVYLEWSDQKTYSLYISNVVKSISGAYKCVTVRDGQQYTLTYNVEAYDPPYFVNTEDVQYAINGKDSLITCEARGDSDLSIRWHKGGEEFVEITDDEKYKITSEGLVIIGATENDKGVYKCIAFEIETVEAIDKDIKVEVISTPTIVELLAIPDRIVPFNSSLSVECLVAGVPHPEYTWRKISEEDTEETNTTYYQDGNKLIFDSITYEDRGSYECIATNNAGSSASAIEIEVLLPPNITEFNNVTAIEGSIAQIVCKASGHPIPSMSLDFLGEDSDDQSFVWDTKNTSFTDIEFYLSFLRINRTHDGVYICNATNKVSSASSEMYLSVLYAPYFNVPFERVWVWNNQHINLSCEHQSNPPAVVTWNYRLTNKELSTEEQVEINKIMASSFHNNPLIIENKTLYGIFECVAKNEFGQANKTFLVQEGFVPSAINSVAIQNVTSNSVTFAIEGPYEVFGPEVIGYKSEYDDSENYNITDIHMNRTWSIDRPFKLDRLRSNTSYYIKFAAINNVGEGSWSETFKFVTLEKSTPEEPRWEENVQELVETSKVLKWKTVDSDDAVDSYTIRYCPMFNGLVEDGKCEEESIERTDEFDLNKMESNITYYFELVAHNSIGNSSTAHVIVTTSAEDEPLLSGGVIIIIAIIVVFICLFALDLLLLLWRKQGVIASCCIKKKNKREASINSRDKKGLLKQNSDRCESQRLNGHREYEYNKTTGIITGKHSAV
ncbi:unnamed protein product, partial [Brenthis ino]